ncbi:hypothetical protein ACJ41O_006113 [Fusarium nematophilum]
MKVSAITSLLAATVSALPAVSPGSSIEDRQIGASTRNDLNEADSASCADVIFIFARGTSEPGNLGTLVGPRVASALEDGLGEGGVLIQGVGGDYRAGVADNALPRGTSDDAIQEMLGLLDEANTKCPDATIVAGGYSQGAALVAAAIEDTDQATRDKIAGVVLFGYTQNEQNNGQIPNFPPERTQVFCNNGDLVCEGTLIVVAAHLAYGNDASGAGPDFLIQQVGGA